MFRLVLTYRHRIFGITRISIVKFFPLDIKNEDTRSVIKTQNNCLVIQTNWVSKTESSAQSQSFHSVIHHYGWMRYWSLVWLWLCARKQLCCSSLRMCMSMCLYKCENERTIETEICGNIDAALFTTPHTVYYCYCMSFFDILKLATSCTLNEIFLAEHFADLLLVFRWEKNRQRTKPFGSVMWGCFSSTTKIDITRYGYVSFVIMIFLFLFVWCVMCMYIVCVMVNMFNAWNVHLNWSLILPYWISYQFHFLTFFLILKYHLISKKTRNNNISLYIQFLDFLFSGFHFVFDHFPY